MFKNKCDFSEASLIKCIECNDIIKFNDSINLITNSDSNSNNTFSVIHQNIRSYNKNIDEFMVVLDSLSFKFNCIVLTEAWLNNESNIVSLNGYNMYRSYNSLNQSDGLVIYIDNSLSVSCKQLSLGGIATALSLTFNWEGMPCHILAVYRSPNSSLINFSNSLFEILNSNLNKKDVSIFTGDINCDLLNVSANSVEEHYLDLLSDLGFAACVDKVTRPASNTCIDHYFIRLPNTLSASSIILQTHVTDHFAVCLQIKSNKTPSNFNSQTNEKLFVLKTDWENVKKSLVSQSWDKVLTDNDASSSTKSFIEILQNLVHQNTKQIKRSAKFTKLKPWMTVGLLNSIRRRDKLSKTLKKQPFNIPLRNEFVRLRNSLHFTIKQTKFNYYRNKVNEVSKDSKKFWSVVNEVAGRPKQKEPFPVDAFLGPGDTVTPVKIKEISNSINNYFSSVGSRLAEDIKPSGPAEVSDADHSVMSVFELQPVTRQTIFDVVYSIRGQSAPGWDAIPANLIKYNIYNLSEPLLHIINMSIRTGKFPNAFKVAKVVPIYKSGDKNSFSNFRPISLLIVLSKILEKCVKIQLSSYLNQQNLISDVQYGFRSNKNTSDALFDLTKFISNQISLNKRILVTFLDLAKAFDSVDRNKLIAKLEATGVKNKTLDWFKSYFQGRLQTVTINGIVSDATSVDYGVVQGSTLGPILFLVYINNISKLNIGGKLFLFADDTVVVSTGCTWDETFSRASIDLTKIKNWFDHNSLTVNIGKTKCMPIFTNKLHEPGLRSLKMHSCGDPRSTTCSCGVIERVTQYKYLGVIIDNRLNWCPHIGYVKNLLRKCIFAFNQLNGVLTVGQCRTVYYAYVQSLLQYGILGWGGASSSILEPLAVSQRTIIKAVLKRNHRYPSALLFEEFPVLNIRQLFIKTLLSYIKNNKTEILVEIPHNYPTRHKINYGYSMPKLKHGSELTNSFYLAQVVYRNLPNYLRDAESDSDAIYKRKVDKWLYHIGWVATEALLHSPYL